MREQRGIHRSIPARSTRQQPRTVRTDNVAVEEYDEEEEVYTRPPSSVRRYQPAPIASAPARTEIRVTRHDVPRRATRTEDQIPAQPRPRSQVQPARPRPHWLIFVGLGMIAAIAFAILLSGLVGWWNGVQEDWHYGNPRIERVTAVVGHGDSAAHPSLFFGINANSRVQVIECPASDCSKAKSYIAPVIVTHDMALYPVTLTFQDVNGDGLLDMLVHIDQNTSVFMNDHGAFRPVTEQDHVTM